MARELEADRIAIEKMALGINGLVKKSTIKTAGAPPIYLVWFSKLRL